MELDFLKKTAGLIDNVPAKSRVVGTAEFPRERDRDLDAEGLSVRLLGKNLPLERHLGGEYICLSLEQVRDLGVERFLAVVYQRFSGPWRRA